MDFVRDHAMYVSVFGLFSFVWFGWAQENPRPHWRKYLGIASGTALLLCLYGVYLSVTHWDAPSALADDGPLRGYLISVYAEIAVCGIGAYLLIRRRRSGLVAPWIAFIVGVHFIGLRHVFDDAGLYVLAALLVAVAAAAPFVAPRLRVANSAVTGIGAGASLFGFALLGLVRFFASV
ncbi:hypothetical protein I8J29_18245 [Paenibacillus sp. MWE-103]|uniref:Uncharacterized protein n=1 Tax=Paenibacillus artemisiicola TaxID=1172618 RepID=A0ABS3WCW7_9BACL|nr:hypothetical protein [Paenibacillus artemisiicola]MBO7746154.1 hypothetical protein [Paenibacillus artemisiicola]